MASKMTFHESYGDVSVAQLRAYKRYNVSPSDHDDLVRVFGDRPEAITRAVLDYSPNGYYNGYAALQALYRL